MKWEQCFVNVCDSVFRIRITSSGGRFTGTGFVAGVYEVNQKLSCVLATAKHLVIKLREDENVLWEVQKINWHGDVVGEVKFESNISKLGNGPVRLYQDTDIAMLAIPIVDFPIKPVRIIHPSYEVYPGTRVGWAGFPSFTRKRTNDRQYPCYFEGVISSVVIEKGRLFYFVDGHGGEGVSGGPLWYWNDEQSNYEVIGICSQYLKAGDTNLAAPGMVVFESVKPLITYLSTSSEITMNIIH
jgi:hypothetical protein